MVSFRFLILAITEDVCSQLVRSRLQPFAMCHMLADKFIHPFDARIYLVENPAVTVGAPTK